MKSDTRNKVNSELYKGIEYIQIQNLPKDQQEALLNWIDKDNVFTIMIGNALVKDCVQYSDYCYWYEQVLTAKEPTPNSSKNAPLKRLFGFAFDNQ